MATLETLLEVVQNAETFSTRIKSLQAEQAKLESMIAVFGKASEIDGLHATATKLKTEAEDTLESAKAMAVEIVKNAKEAASVILVDAAAVKQSAAAQLDKATTERLALEAELNEAKRSRKKIRNDLELAATLKKEAETELAEVRAKHDKLKAVLS